MRGVKDRLRRICVFAGSMGACICDFKKGILFFLFWSGSSRAQQHVMTVLPATTCERAVAACDAMQLGALCAGFQQCWNRNAVVFVRFVPAVEVTNRVVSKQAAVCAILCGMMRL